MKHFRAEGIPVISQCLPAEGGRLALRHARRNLKASKHGHDTGTVYVTGDVFLPKAVGAKIEMEELPIAQFHPADKVSRRMFINSLTAADRVIVLFEREDQFMRKGFYDYSLEHKLIWQIRNGHFGRWRNHSEKPKEIYRPQEVDCSQFLVPYDPAVDY